MGLVCHAGLCEESFGVYGFFAMLGMKVLSISVCFVNHAAQLVVELSVLHQGFQREVHAVTPVVTRVGRHIDAFGLCVRVTEIFVHRQPVLERKDAEQ